MNSDLVLNETTLFAITTECQDVDYNLLNCNILLPCGHCFGYLMYETVLLTSDHTVIRSCNSHSTTHILFNVKYQKINELISY